MKKQTRTVLLGAATLAAIAVSGGHEEAQAATKNITAKAIIIAPIAVTAKQNLHFGTITVAAATSGTVTVDNTGARAKAGGVSLVTGAGLEQEGKFGIQAASGVAYDVTVGATGAVKATLTKGGGNTINVTAITIAGNATQKLANATQTVATKTYAVGATLKVPGGQTTGTYAGNILVTAVYD